MLEFKKGDNVQHRSGGPRMTVYDVEGEEVVCEWFDEKKEDFQRRVFDNAMLDKIEE